MCDYDDGERPDVWRESTHRARKQHRCDECRMPIVVGTVYVRCVGMYDGHWYGARVHPDCFALLKHIAFTVCGQDSYVLNNPDGLRWRVREHYREAPEVLRMWRDILRARRAEGVWPVRRAA